VPQSLYLREKIACHPVRSGQEASWALELVWMQCEEEKFLPGIESQSCSP